MSVGKGNFPPWYLETEKFLINSILIFQTISIFFILLSFFLWKQQKWQDEYVKAFALILCIYEVICSLFYQVEEAPKCLIFMLALGINGNFLEIGKLLMGSLINIFSKSSKHYCVLHNIYNNNSWLKMHGFLILLTKIIFF